MEAKKSLNITKLTTTNMPAGCGRKGSLPPPKKKKDAIKLRVSSSEVMNQGRSEESQDQSLESPKHSDEFTSIANSPMSVTPCVGNFELTCHGGSVNVGSVTTSGNLLLPRTPPDTTPQPPPPLIQCASSSPDGSTFSLCFIKGNIRVCRGCRQNYTKPAVPPMDLCVRHQEWQKFTGPGGTLERRFVNVYYHLNLPCIRSGFPSFEPSMVEISPVVAMQLLPVHTHHLLTHMPGRL